MDFVDASLSKQPITFKFIRNNFEITTVTYTERYTRVHARSQRFRCLSFSLTWIIFFPLLCHVVHILNIVPFNLAEARVHIHIQLIFVYSFFVPTFVYSLNNQLNCDGKSFSGWHFFSSSSGLFFWSVSLRLIIVIAVLKMVHMR